MKKVIQYTLLSILQVILFIFAVAAQGEKTENEQIDLSGTWSFQLDSLDKGIPEKWFSLKLKDKIKLPGSMTTNGIGNEITVNTPWTGQIVDSTWFFNPAYAKYRKAGNVKIPFWLQPEKYYKGAAWYQKTIHIPASWKGKLSELYIERSHWETTVWIDNVEIGMENSLGTAHVFELGEKLTPGTHLLTVRIDNRVKDFNVGQNSHSISDHTQTNWNGMVGELSIRKKSKIFITDVQLYPDLENKQVRVKVQVNNSTGIKGKIAIALSATAVKAGEESLRPVTKAFTLTGKSSTFEMVYPMGSDPLLWNEFHPHLYQLKVQLTHEKSKDTDSRQLSFGMRDFKAKGTQFMVNDQVTFLRGTLDCASFPKTGYPPTDVESWIKSFKAVKAYGLNHVRFHSWCPPEAAFAAADRLGIYLQVECSSWANQGAVIGDGRPLDKYIYRESERMVKAYGNHPSFVMMTYGNEPAGKNHVAYLTSFVNFWKAKDARRLYTTAAGWPVVTDNDYNNTPDPRIQAWGEGLKSIINKEAPKADYDWSGIISKWKQPTVSHEIGQWCVYPNFKEIKKYDGVLKAKNFEIFQDQLQINGMSKLADSFFLASGKLQVLCYKADIEAALRTPGFAGFQLLGLNDFPGQGTALVGVLDPFWEDKGYVTGSEYSRFCNTVVPLVRLPKMIYLNTEELVLPIEVANFGETPLKGSTIKWTISSEANQKVFQGKFENVNVALGNGIKAATIRQELNSIKEAQRLILKVSIGNFENSWDIFVYPKTLPQLAKGVLVTQTLDKNAIQQLNDGGNVLLTLKKGSVKPEMGGAVKIGFSSIFWNTAWTKQQPPTTLGILCDPRHPAFSDFPTQFHSNWQWWDAMSHSSALKLDAVAADLTPIVRVIDDWVTAQPLGLIFECKVGKGKLLVSGVDLLSGKDSRPEARQLLYSLENYMNGNHFKPAQTIDLKQIQGILTDNN